MIGNLVLIASLAAFNYGGKPAEGLGDAKAVRTVRDDADAKTVVREWISPDGRLLYRSTETEYKKFPVTEYVPELVCRGEEPTEIVDGFHTLSLARPSARTVLRALHGTVCSERDFAPETSVIGTGGGEKRTFAMVATEGRPSAQWMPWWGVDFADGSGLEIGLGWTGAWRADFAGDGTNFTMSAGMVKTHFRLLKGETLRQPSLLVFRRAKGETPRAMQTLIHRFMVDVKSPRDAKGELIRGICAITAGGGNKPPAMMKKIIDWKVANGMPFNCFWVDAGWNGPAHRPDLLSNCGDKWWQFVGDWRFNPTVHPDGDLGKVADAAHAAGMRMLLWMEPERCVCEPAPPLYREHRSFLLPKDDKDVRNKRELLLNLGDPGALAWLIETVSDIIRRSKLDVFRQDFNFNTLPLWQANDAPDRQGVTEAKHVMGLWAFWDALRARFPHLVIENCASGGRRLDFEAVSRAHSYCRTDYAIGHGDPGQIVDVQNITLNTIPYLPFQGSESTPSVYFFDDYGIFSSFASGNVFTPSDWNGGIVKNDFTAEQVAWLRETYAAARRMMPFYEGDWYPLTDSRASVVRPIAWWSRNEEEMRWCAWQLHRPDQDAGFAIFFRRANAPSHVFMAELGGIDESADYQVETWRGKSERMSGKALRRLAVELRQPRSFRLVFYRKAGVAGQPKTVLELPPGEGNPRNSEGALAALADGRILFAYSKYVGSDHDDNASCVIALRTSGDGGETWSDDRIVARNSVETNGNVMSVSFLHLDARRLAMFYIQKERTADGKDVRSRILMKETSDGGENWSEPLDCTGAAQLPKGYYVLNNDRVVRLKSGRIVIPLALGDSSGAVCAYSDDGGRTWKASARVLAPPAADGKRILFEEPGLVELRDGSVILYLRTSAGRQWRAVSSDGCATWGAAEPWRFASPRSPMQIVRLKEGSLLAVWNDMTRHPERLKKSPPWTCGPRTPLTLAVSTDDGETWSAGKDLETSFDPRNFLRYWYCYPAVLELGDRLLIAYCAENSLRKLRMMSVPKSWLGDAK